MDDSMINSDVKYVKELKCVCVCVCITHWRDTYLEDNITKTSESQALESNFMSLMYDRTTDELCDFRQVINLVEPQFPQLWNMVNKSTK